MKRLLISVLDYCNIKFDKAAIEAAEKIEVSEENMATINSKLEEAKGFKQQLEASIADLEKVKGELATANATIVTLTTAKEKAEGELATATESLTAAQKEIAELHEAAGTDPTNAGSKGSNEDEASTPDWLDTNAEHYKALQAAGINPFHK